MPPSSFTTRFLLRDAEARARKFSDEERAELAAQVLVVRQKLLAAQLLWAHRQYAECLRLAEEGVTEALLALALAEAALRDDTPESLRQLRGRAAALSPVRPRFNAELTAGGRAYFERAVALLLAVTDGLAPLGRLPRQLVLKRWGRVAVIGAGLLMAGLAGALLVYKVRAERAEQDRQVERASRDGYLFREEGSNTVFVVQAGTRLPIPSAQEFNALGYRWEAVEIVAPGTLDHLRASLPDHTLVKERGNPATYLVEGGKKRFVASPEALDRLRRQRKDTPVRVVPVGLLGSLPAGDPLP